MRKIDAKWVKQNLAVSGAAARKFLPFPGRDPLRWAIWVKFADGEEFKYVGKPNQQVALKVWRLLQRKARGKASLVELDRGGALSKSQVAMPVGVGQIIAAIQSWNHSVVQYAIPGGYRNETTILWATAGIPRTQLIHKKKPVVLYEDPKAFNNSLYVTAVKKWLNERL